MTIIEESYAWAYPLTKRRETACLILHHAAASSASAQDIHRWHLGQGWSGIGYHYYVRKDGQIYRGRPEETRGAHCAGMNDESVGVCFEGDFERERMGEAQLAAGRTLIADIRRRYPGIAVGGHGDYAATACPGRYFPLGKLTKEESMSGEEIYRALCAYLAGQSLPDWAKAELQEAVDAGITDGTRPMELIPRYQAAIMAKRSRDVGIAAHKKGEDET